MTADRVIAAVSRLRLHTVEREVSLYAVLEHVFLEESLRFRAQVRLRSGDRIDYLLDEGLGIEVKAGPVARTSTVEQLERYAASDCITSLLLVTERGLPGLPENLGGKPVRQIALQQLWGIAS